MMCGSPHCVGKTACASCGRQIEILAVLEDLGSIILLLAADRNGERIVQLVRITWLGKTAEHGCSRVQVTMLFYSGWPRRRLRTACFERFV